MRSRLIMMVFILLFITACGGGGEPATSAADGVLQITTTTSMITDITKVVGGDQVQVSGLMGAGIDPHLYVASEGDMELLQNADVIFYNGLLLEAQMAEILEQLGQRKTVVAVTTAIDEDALLPWAQYADEFDPHIWFDVTLWMKAVEVVRDTLVAADAANADAYRANADAYLEELAQLDAYVKEQAALVPAAQRILITAHDAFHYFGRAYGFEVRGLQGISTASEAGTGDVQALADFIAEKEIKAIFVESSVPVRNIEAVQAAVQSRGFQVSIGGELFSDALGDPNAPEGTYVGMVRHNIDTIVGALLGNS